MYDAYTLYMFMNYVCLCTIYVYALYMISVHYMCLRLICVYTLQCWGNRSLEVVGQYSQSVDTRVSERHKEK